MLVVDFFCNLIVGSYRDSYRKVIACESAFICLRIVNLKFCHDEGTGYKDMVNDPVGNDLFEPIPCALWTVDDLFRGQSRVGKVT